MTDIPEDVMQAAREAACEQWQDLCEKSDRTSPDDTPEMALITQYELGDYIARSILADRARRVKERIAEAETQAKKYEGLAEEAAECLLEWANLVKAKTSEIEALAGENRRLRETPERPWTSEEISALQDLLAKTAGRLAAAEADAERLAEAATTVVYQTSAKHLPGYVSVRPEGFKAMRAALAAHEARKG